MELGGSMKPYSIKVIGTTSDNFQMAFVYKAIKKTDLEAIESAKKVALSLYDKSKPIALEIFETKGPNHMEELLEKIVSKI